MRSNNIKYIINSVRINIARAVERNDMGQVNILVGKLNEFRQAVGSV
jgi:hypothetical protein